MIIKVRTMMPSTSESARILAVFPFSARSHFNMFQPLLDKLVERGHYVTVLSHFPRQDAKENYRDISLKMSTVPSQDNNVEMELGKFTLLDDLMKMSCEIDDYEPIFELDEVKKLLYSDEKFDLILTEVFNSDLFAAFAYKFKAPLMTMSACPLLPWAHQRFGNPFNPSHVPVVFNTLTSPMDIKSRVTNTVHLIVSLAFHKMVLLPKSQKLADKYFGNIPRLEELIKNTSLILVNTHFSLEGSQPISPNVIPVGGMHIQPAKKLPKDLEDFISGAQHGVIILSMGSMFKSDSLPEEKRRIFLQCFANLPQRVIWKWEEDTMTGLTNNIKLVKWLPQRDLLGDSRIKLLISHGGLLGLSEAVWCGVPVLCMPLFGDMGHNSANLESRGAGAVLPYHKLTLPALESFVHELLYNQKYQDNAKKLSMAYRDRLVSPVEEAVYWTEYVLRNKGPGFLKPSTANMSFIKQNGWDIAVILISTSLVVVEIVHQIYCNFSNGSKWLYNFIKKFLRIPH